MPKTKLGNETKDHVAKKARVENIKCDMSARLAEEGLKFYKEAVCHKTESSESIGIRIYKTPFTCTVIDNLTEGDEFLEAFKGELMDLDFVEKNNDLYKFRQSGELSQSKLPLVSKFKDMLVHELRPWIQNATGIALSESVDLFCAQYKEGDTLLCHDDELEGRRIAFIFYLVPEDWQEEDGGTLDLFNTDSGGNPADVSRRLLPKFNSLAFFEVSPVSFHQVSEVLSSNKIRLSLGGWFHGKSLPRPQRAPPVKEPCVEHQEISEDEFYSWVNPMYLDPNTQSEVQTKFEETSEISLPGFLRKEKFDQVCEALDDVSEWNITGLPDRKRCRQSQGEGSPILQSCLKFFRSEPLFLMLANLTGLKLHELAPEDSDDEEDNGEEGDPRCRAAFINWQPGTYSLVRDDDEEQAEAALDLRIFFNSSGWSDVMGGQSSYIARGEDEELITVEPEDNSLSLVYRDKESLRFVKYVSEQAKSIGGFQDLSATYYE